jgi:hypothetical protein
VPTRREQGAEAFRHGQSPIPTGGISGPDAAEWLAGYEEAGSSDAPETPGNVTVHVGPPIADSTDHIQNAIGQLDPGDAVHFTTGGKPSAGALGEILGRRVTGKERDDAWEIYQRGE